MKHEPASNKYRLFAKNCRTIQVQQCKLQLQRYCSTALRRKIELMKKSTQTLQTIMITRMSFRLPPISYAGHQSVRVSQQLLSLMAESGVRLEDILKQAELFWKPLWEDIYLPIGSPLYFSTCFCFSDKV